MDQIDKIFRERSEQQIFAALPGQDPVARVRERTAMPDAALEASTASAERQWQTTSAA